MAVSKRDLFAMSASQATAGKREWQRTGQVGRLTRNSFNAEDTAPKTWILWVNNKGEELATIECELYVVGRHSDKSEGIGMLNGMCPKCGETFIVREDNKQMSIERISFRKAPKHIKINWNFHCRNVLGRAPSGDDQVIVVSSPERWACDYCHGWCVKVTAGVAITDMTGVTQIVVHGRPHLIDK